MCCMVIVDIDCVCPARVEVAYTKDVQQRARHASHLIEEHCMNEEVARHMALASLHHNVKVKEQRALKRAERREEALAKVVSAERHRLVEIVKRATNGKDEANAHKAKGLKGLF